MKYAELLRKPGVLGLLLAAMVAKLAAGIVPFSSVAAFTDRSQPVMAGISYAAFLVLAALAGPWRGRLVDRYGAHRTLPVLAVVFAVLVSAAAASLGDYPVLSVGAVAAAACFMPPVGAVLRTTWTAIAADDQDNRGLHALDSALEELTFVLSPLVTSAIWVTLGSGWAMLTGGATALAGVLLLLAAARAVRGPVWAVFQRRRTPTHHQPGPPRSRPARLIWSRNGSALLLPMAGLGIAIGATTVALPSWARDHQAAAVSGVLLAVISAAGVVTGLIYGRTTIRAGRWHQYLAAGALVALGTAVLATAPPLPVAVIGTILIGAGMTPMFVIAFLLIGDTVPSHRHTEANAAIGAAYNLGSGASAAACGALLAVGPVPVAFLTAAVATAACLSAVPLRRQPQPADAEISAD